MAKITEEQIRAVLHHIKDPIHDGTLADNQRIQSIVIKAGNIGITLEIQPDEADKMEPIRKQIEQDIRAQKGVISASCILTSHSETLPQNAAKSPASREIPAAFEHIKYVIAVASGKGGVGKSTIATQLATQLSTQGYKTGLLDADIYGPSLPDLLDIHITPEVDTNKKLIPLERFGVLTMSIGYMVKPEQAMIWRGPMVQSALLQMLNDVAWPPLDILVLDLPPGTGDIQLTMAQRFPVSGALIVSTPHMLSLADMRRSAHMFKRVNIPILGVIENMAYLTTPKGDTLYPFGESAKDMLTQIEDMTYLGALPIDPDLQTIPLAPQSQAEKLFTHISAQIVEKMTTL